MFWDLDGLDEAHPLPAQADELQEDLAQVEYPGGVVLDIGWYPEFSERGAFNVYVVSNDDWDHPLFQRTCPTFAALWTVLAEATALAAKAGSHE